MKPACEWTAAEREIYEYGHDAGYGDRAWSEGDVGWPAWLTAVVVGVLVGFGWIVGKWGW
jgi:hypothetical protein